MCPIYSKYVVYANILMQIIQLLHITFILQIILKLQHSFKQIFSCLSYNINVLKTNHSDALHSLKNHSYNSHQELMKEEHTTAHKSI